MSSFGNFGDIIGRGGTLEKAADAAGKLSNLESIHWVVVGLDVLSAIAFLFSSLSFLLASQRASLSARLPRESQDDYDPEQFPPIQLVDRY